MASCIMIVAGHLGRKDWVFSWAANKIRPIEIEAEPLYNTRQLVEYIERTSREPAAARGGVVVLEARMAEADVYSAMDEWKTENRWGAVPVVVVTTAGEGQDRIARGYIYGLAPEASDSVPLRRFSKRIAAPPGMG